MRGGRYFKKIVVAERAIFFYHFGHGRRAKRRCIPYGFFFFVIPLAFDTVIIIIFFLETQKNIIIVRTRVNA